MIESLNNIKIDEITNEIFFKKNIFTLFHKASLGKFINPLYKNFQHIFHFGSFLFDKKIFNDKDNVNISNIMYSIVLAYF